MTKILFSYLLKIWKADNDFHIVSRLCVQSPCHYYSRVYCFDFIPIHVLIFH